MNVVNKDLIIIGGGPAGLAAAIGAKRNGTDDILILERGDCLGGILTQCIHAGFGLHTFGEELTGPEYAARYIEELEREKIEYKLGAMVLSVERLNTAAKNPIQVTCVSSADGLVLFNAKAVILAMGCRERARGALNIAGTRPAGVYTAGTAQYYVNLEGKMVGKKVVILGSGDIGLIMARRLTLEGAQVLMVCELMPYSNGLGRNIAQCLEDFNIPLRLSHTVVAINGSDRVSSVTIAKVDEKLMPIPESFETVECDTLLLSVGLIPENELTTQAGAAIDPITGGATVNELLATDVEGIFACGNVLHVHDLVDYVSDEATRAGRNASQYIAGAAMPDNTKKIRKEGMVRYVVPQEVSDFSASPLLFRVSAPSQGKTVIVKADGKPVYSKKVPFLTPSEMQRIDLSAEACKLLNSSDEVVVAVE